MRFFIMISVAVIVLHAEKIAEIYSNHAYFPYVVYKSLWPPFVDFLHGFFIGGLILALIMDIWEWKGGSE